MGRLTRGSTRHEDHRHVEAQYDGDDGSFTLEGFEDTGIEDAENIVYPTNGACSVSVVTDPAAGCPGDSILLVSVATG